MTTGEVLADLWSAVLARVVIRHPNPNARPRLTINRDGAAPPILLVQIDGHCDTGTARRPQWETFTIANTRLAYFPGDKLAEMWLAAAWSGYVQHEGLELVTVADKACLDPHAEPHRYTPWNRGLRDGFPAVLTEATFLSTLAVAMSRESAERLVAEVGA